MFDLVIGNPPYQKLTVEGLQKSSVPLYDKFVEKAAPMADFVSMIIPSTWFNGGKGLDDFRRKMLVDFNVTRMSTYSRSTDAFGKDVSVPGGVCYFLIDSSFPKNGLCVVTNVLNRKGRSVSSCRRLDEFPVFLADNKAVGICRKAMLKAGSALSSSIRARNVFNVDSTFSPKEGASSEYQVYTYKGLFPIGEGEFFHDDCVDKYKVIISKSRYEKNLGDKDFRILNKIKILPPKVVCSDSYLVAGAFDDENKALNLVNYLRSKTVRLLISLGTSGSNISRRCFEFVPEIPKANPKNWDEFLFEHFGFSPEETTYVKDVMLEWEERWGDGPRL